MFLQNGSDCINSDSDYSEADFEIFNSIFNSDPSLSELFSSIPALLQVNLSPVAHQSQVMSYSKVWQKVIH